MNYYHVYNRGAHKENLFHDHQDLERFIDCMSIFQERDTKIKINRLPKTELKRRRNEMTTNPLVFLHAFCLLPNHFHLLVSCEDPYDLSKYMQKLGTAYSMYYNTKYNHSGTIFQGTYKKVLVESDGYFLHLLAYVNCNHILHNTPKYKSRTSFHSYFLNLNPFLDIRPITSRFRHRISFERFCMNHIQGTKMIREKLLNLE